MSDDMYEHLVVPDAALDAWVNPGRCPALHEQMKQNVRHEMPLLARALDRAAEERKNS